MANPLTIPIDACSHDPRAMVFQVIHEGYERAESTEDRTLHITLRNLKAYILVCRNCGAWQNVDDREVTGDRVPRPRRSGDLFKGKPIEDADPDEVQASLGE